MFALSLAYVMAFTLDLWGAVVSLVQQPQFLVAVLALATPLAIAVIKQPFIPDRFDRPIAWTFAALVGFLTVYTTGQFNTADLLTSIPLIVAATEASYQVIWKHQYALSLWEAFTTLPFVRDRFGDVLSELDGDDFEEAGESDYDSAGDSDSESAKYLS